MKKIIFTLYILSFATFGVAQVKIGDNSTTLNASSLLELETTNKGLLLPRVALTSTTSFAPLASHVLGMSVYNTATTADVTPGLYIDSGTAWVKFVSTELSVVTVTSSPYNILGTEDIILANTGAASIFTLPATAAVGKKIIIANKFQSGGIVSIRIASGGIFWNGSGFGTGAGNSNTFTYTGVNGWICEVIGY